MSTGSFRVRVLGVDDVEWLEKLLTLFGEAFAEPKVYGAARPSSLYLQTLLASKDFIALIALKGDDVVGGAAAYVLPKFEQARSEVYLYDLAVGVPHRRAGIATALIVELKKIAAARGAYVIFVQADRSDAPAVALYSKFGAAEDVVHFDIPVTREH